MSVRLRRFRASLIISLFSLVCCRSASKETQQPKIDSTPQIAQQAPPPYRPSPYPTPAKETVVGPAWTLVTKKFSRVSHRWKYSLEGQYPQFDNARDRRAHKFNREIKRRIVKQYLYAISPRLQDFRDQVRMFPKEDPLETAEFDYEIMYSHDSVLSIRFHDITYSRGAAHPLESYFTLNYQLGTGEILRLKDLFKPHVRLKRNLMKVCEKKLDEQRIRLVFPESLSVALRNYDKWNLTKDGLLMNFDRCDIAACGYGEIAILIPYQELKDLLNPSSPAYKILSAKL